MRKEATPVCKRFSCLLLLAIAATLWSLPRSAVAITLERPEEAPESSDPRDPLDELVAPIALYPDDLLAVVLPAATFPIQVVQASRFLAAREQDPERKPDAEWDPSLLALLNYPEALALLNDDLDWTWELGAAVLDDQAAVMNAVQRFRHRVYAAGNLESDEGRTVMHADEAIVIQPSEPEVIYVPVYQPSRVVVLHTGPPLYWYSAPYPYYYYPSAAFWTGFYLGSAGIVYGLSWGGYGYPYYHHHHRIVVHRDVYVHKRRGGHHKADGNRRGRRWEGGRDEMQGGRPGRGDGRNGSNGGEAGNRAGGRERGDAGSQRPNDRSRAGERSRTGTRGDRPGQAERGGLGGENAERAGGQSRRLALATTRGGRAPAESRRRASSPDLRDQGGGAGIAARDSSRTSGGGTSGASSRSRASSRRGSTSAAKWLGSPPRVDSSGTATSSSGQRAGVRSARTVAGSHHGVSRSSARSRPRMLWGSGGASPGTSMRSHGRSGTGASRGGHRMGGNRGGRRGR